jgi:hypothetical protein
MQTDTQEIDGLLNTNQAYGDREHYHQIALKLHSTFRLELLAFIKYSAEKQKSVNLASYHQTEQSEVSEQNHVKLRINTMAPNYPLAIVLCTDPIFLRLTIPAKPPLSLPLAHWPTARPQRLGP